MNRDKFDKRSLFALWDLISLGYTFFFLAIEDTLLRREMQVNRSGLVNKMSNDITIVGKFARIVQFLENTNAAPEIDKLYDICLTML